VIKQSPLEDKEAYLKKGALVVKKRPQYSCMSKRRSFEASLSKPYNPVWQTRISGFGKKFQNFRVVQQRLQGGT
jgi:hypothetical protein